METHNFKRLFANFHWCISGVIILEGCTIELSDHEDGFTFMIHYPGSGTRTYILSADTQEEMEGWMKVSKST